MILIINDHGDRLCGDGRWREFAMFGSFKSCVKTYRKLGNAKARAKQVHGHVVQVPQGMEVDASGKVLETIPCPDQPGYVTHQHHKLQEFIHDSSSQIHQH